jgi:hypothetical protein
MKSDGLQDNRLPRARAVPFHARATDWKHKRRRRGQPTWAGADSAHMTDHAPLCLVLLLTTACFPAPADYDEALRSPETLAVEDLGGALFSAQHAPRDPVLVLHFADRAPADPEQALRLVPGIVAEPLVARLASGSKLLAQRALPLQVLPSPRGLVVQPQRPLPAGARFTLAWLAAEHSKSFPLLTAGGSALGARLIETWPRDGASQVPTQLARALLRFDGSVVGELPSHITLACEHGVVASQLSVEPCGARGFEEGDCVWLAPAAALEPDAHCQLEVAPGLHTLTGAAIAPSQSRFVVAPMPPASALLPTRCAPDEALQHELCTRCDDRALFVRGVSSESVLITLLQAVGDAVHSAAALSAADGFELALPLAPDTARVRVQSSDLAGHALERELQASRARDLAQLTIDEVRPDPLGKEPAQEYVELLNFGATPVSLMGFTLTTDVHERGRRIEAAVMLAAGERALLVAPDFDARDGSDGALPGGTRIVTLDGALALPNSGGTLFLRDAEGRRVAAARVLSPWLEGQCSARYPGAAPRGGAPEQFELDPNGSCTPGAPSFLPSDAPP